jgi:OOP family OmpA-OmpF porin
MPSRILLVTAFFAVLACASSTPRPPIQASPLVPGKGETVAIDQLVVLVDGSASVDEDTLFQDQKALVESFARAMPDGQYETGAITFGGFERQNTGPARFDRNRVTADAANVRYLAEGTPIHKAIGEAGDQLSGKSGRAAIVLYSDGLPTDEIGREIDPQLSYDAVAGVRQRYDGTVCVHTVQTGSDPAGAAFLKQLAGNTSDCGSFRQLGQVTTVASLHQLERDVFLGAATPDVAAAPPDTDGDGVIDPRDECPGTPRGAVVDARGCWNVKGLMFAHDSSAIDADGEKALDEVATVLRRNPDLHVQIDGHTDAVGTNEYNRALSDRRADAARKYLTATGIDASRLVSKGFGESQPVADNGTAEGRASNRRTEIEVVE